MGNNRFWDYVYLATIAFLLLNGIVRADDRAELKHLLKDRDVQKIYQVAAQQHEPIIARMGTVDEPSDKEVRCLWLIVRTPGLGMRIHYFNSIDNNKVLVLIFDKNVTDAALVRLLRGEK